LVYSSLREMGAVLIGVALFTPLAVRSAHVSRTIAGTTETFVCTP
jgi:NADH:ubiquinone oxidoreductase subunit 4 (subunit M)